MEMRIGKGERHEERGAKSEEREAGSAKREFCCLTLNASRITPYDSSPPLRIKRAGAEVGAFAGEDIVDAHEGNAVNGLLVRDHAAIGRDGVVGAAEGVLDQRHGRVVAGEVDDVQVLRRIG